MSKTATEQASVKRKAKDEVHMSSNNSGNSHWSDNTGIATSMVRELRIWQRFAPISVRQRLGGKPEASFISSGILAEHWPTTARPFMYALETTWGDPATMEGILRAVQQRNSPLCIAVHIDPLHMHIANVWNTVVDIDALAAQVGCYAPLIPVAVVHIERKHAAELPQSVLEKVIAKTAASGFVAIRIVGDGVDQYVWDDIKQMLDDVGITCEMRRSLLPCLSIDSRLHTISKKLVNPHGMQSQTPTTHLPMHLSPILREAHAYAATTALSRQGQCREAAMHVAERLWHIVLEDHAAYISSLDSHDEAARWNREAEIIDDTLHTRVGAMGIV